MTDSIALREAWEEHPHFRYRGCAPDADVPGMAAGDPSLSLDAWHGEDRDGSEPQRERLAREAAAVEVCLNCPVMVACDAYANSVTTEGGKARLAEPAGIWGGRLALERHRAFIKRRHEVAVPAPDRLVMTEQRVAVLRALAVDADPVRVAAAAGVDLRTANWQRRRLVTMLALPQEATRTELLTAAVERGLLDASVVVADDGSVPAVPPPAPSRATPPTRVSEPLEAVPVIPHGKVYKHYRSPGDVPGQLKFFSTEVVLASAPVIPLHRSKPLEAAA
jgi:hypothetical protein